MTRLLSRTSSPIGQLVTLANLAENAAANLLARDWLEKIVGERDNSGGGKEPIIM